MLLSAATAAAATAAASAPQRCLLLLACLAPSQRKENKVYDSLLHMSTYIRNCLARSWEVILVGKEWEK